MSFIPSRGEEQCTQKDPDAQKRARLWKEKKKEHEYLLQRISLLLYVLAGITQEF